MSHVVTLWGRSPRRARRLPLVETPRSSSCSTSANRFREGPGVLTESMDVLGAIAELPAGVLVALHLACYRSGCPVVHPSTVGVEQPPQEVRRAGVDDLALPGLQDDRPLVLAAGAVLGEKTESVFPGACRDDASWNRACVGSALGLHLSHQPTDLSVECSVFRVVGDVQRPHAPAAGRYVPIAEIPPQQFSVGGLVQDGSVTRGHGTQVWVWPRGSPRR